MYTPQQAPVYTHKTRHARAHTHMGDTHARTIITTKTPHHNDQAGAHTLSHAYATITHTHTHTRARTRTRTHTHTHPLMRTPSNTRTHTPTGAHIHTFNHASRHRTHHAPACK
mmetsp:Transcript_2643/g.6374  ORF Transcript_2643/g.6374 Transcript_2643/m.6374 type:complete len:113 (-) Transcript_2643:142-480(-)